MNGLNHIIVERIAGNLTDHFDPRSNTIRLSDSVYDSTSTAAIGVACHEAGHAAQYAHNYAPIKLRAAIIPVTNFGTKIAWPLMLLGVLLSGMSYAFYNLVYVGIACFSLSLVFQLVTLPVEFDASRRALAWLEQSGLATRAMHGQAGTALRWAAMRAMRPVPVPISRMRQQWETRAHAPSSTPSVPTFMAQRS